jgi:hypothetical protein
MRRMVPRNDPVLVKHYSDLMEVQPLDAQVVEDDEGVYRWREDKLIRWLVDSEEVDLNKVSIAYQIGKFTLQEYMKFYRGLGYSLSGFIETFGEHLWPEEENKE